MSTIHWYPGHMTKARRMIVSQLELIDVVIELLDARIPYSSRNPDIDALAGQKKRVLVLNKSDLADPNINRQWEKYFKAQELNVVCLNLKNNDKNKSGLAKLELLIKDSMKAIAARQKQRGRQNLPIRAMILGIPNSGKSTLINQLSGFSGTKTSDRPGVTRGRQWIKTSIGFDLLDTPGILWPKFEDSIGEYLAITGAISDNVFDPILLAQRLIEILSVISPIAIQKRYKVSTDSSSEKTLEAISLARGHKVKGNDLDINRTAIMLIDEFRAGKTGKISLEKPNDPLHSTKDMLN